MLIIGSTKSMVFRTAKTLMKRLFDAAEPEESVPGDREEDASDEDEPLDLEKMISSATAPKKLKRDMGSKSLNKELGVYVEYGTMSKNLSLLKTALQTIKPTSLESERAFSVAGSFITKVRSSLSDRSVDMLCFLKAYFLAKAEGKH